MITGLDWMESELNRHQKALEKITVIEKFFGAIDALEFIALEEDKELKSRKEKAQEDLAQDKYKAKMYIAMLKYAIRNHMEFKDYRE